MANEEKEKEGRGGVRRILERVKQGRVNMIQKEKGCDKTGMEEKEFKNFTNLRQIS